MGNSRSSRKNLNEKKIWFAKRVNEKKIEFTKNLIAERVKHDEEFARHVLEAVKENLPTEIKESAERSSDRRIG